MDANGFGSHCGLPVSFSLPFSPKRKGTHVWQAAGSQFVQKPNSVVLRSKMVSGCVVVG